VMQYSHYEQAPPVASEAMRRGDCMSI